MRQNHDGNLLKIRMRETQDLVLGHITIERIPWSFHRVLYLMCISGTERKIFIPEGWT